MIKKIVSGGQTGVDRVALDIAIELEMPCGGWCPSGRLAEDGIIPIRYPLDETPSSDYEERTEWNVRDSDGTLIITNLPASGGTAYTIGSVQRLEKPVLIVDVYEAGGPIPEVEDSVGRVRQWLRDESIEVLNVAGPRESKLPGIADIAGRFLRLVLSG